MLPLLWENERFMAPLGGTAPLIQVALQIEADALKADVSRVASLARISNYWSPGK